MPIRIDRLRHPLLEIDSFSTAPNQSWCIYGANNSGIETFFAILAGEITPSDAELSLPEHPGILSFKVQQEIYEQELRNDDSDYLDAPDPGTPARAFLSPDCEQSPLVSAFEMADSLDKGYRQLSSGQSRKLIFLRELLRGSRHLIIQNPYDGLDHSGCSELDRALSALTDHGIQVMITVNIREDIPFWCSHLAILHRGQMIVHGRREDSIGQIDQIHAAESRFHTPDLGLLASKVSPVSSEKDELVYLRNGIARYGEHPVFEGLDLLIHRGCHTLVTGQNGSGKSTLLQIITGDNQGCYANNLRIFGRQRGSGESIWELKQQMGIVSPELHRNYRPPCSTSHVVLSGLFDTIGLYRAVTAFHEQQARQWLHWANLSEKASLPFRRLSFAEQRLALIARALIKLPRLLILDEPTQGLDDHNRYKVLQFLDRIAEEQISTLLFVSHRHDEFLPYFKQHIRMEAFNPAKRQKYVSAAEQQNTDGAVSTHPPPKTRANP